MPFLGERAQSTVSETVGTSMTLAVCGLGTPDLVGVSTQVFEGT